MNEKQVDLLGEINDKLSKILALMAISGKDKKEQIAILVGLNLSNSEISKLTAIPKGTVDGIRAQLKKGR